LIASKSQTNLKDNKEKYATFATRQDITLRNVLTGKEMNIDNFIRTRDKSQYECFNCGKKGHIAKECDSIGARG